MGNTFYSSNDFRDYLAHYGVPGMKWGVRKDRHVSGSTKKANQIYDTLTEQEKYYVTAEKKPPKHYVTKGEYAKGGHNAYNSIEQDHGKPVSVVDLWKGEHDNGLDISLMVRNDPRYRGKGYASRAVKRGVEWFNEHPEFQYIYWSADSKNMASIRTAQKNGFKFVKKLENDTWDLYILDKNDRKENSK